MRENTEQSNENQEALRTQALDGLFDELHCGEKQGGRPDRYDKKRIGHAALLYLSCIGVELPKTSSHTTALGRFLIESKPEDDRDLPGSVMAIVASEAMFRRESTLAVDEKQALYGRTYDTLARIEVEHQRGGLLRFYDETRYRSALIMTTQATDPTFPAAMYETNYQLYEANFGQKVHLTSREELTREPAAIETPKSPGFFHRVGSYLLHGLILMGGPSQLGPQHQAYEQEETDTKDQGDPEDPQRF